MPITPAPAVVRAGEILALLARSPNETRTVSEISRELGLPRATCDSVVQALAITDLVVRDRDLRYGLGPGAITIGDAARAGNPILRIGAEQAEALARDVSGCTALSMRQAGRSTVVEVFDHGPAFGLRAQPGHTIEHIPPFGAAYVAWHDDEVTEWLERSPITLRPTDRRRLEDGLEQVRRHGFSITVASPLRPDLDAALSTLALRPDAEDARRTRDAVVTEMVRRDYLVSELADDSVYRVTLLAAPVFDRRGRAVASILLLGPDHDLTGAEIRARGARVVDTAIRTTRLTGGTVPTSHPRNQGAG